MAPLVSLKIDTQIRRSSPRPLYQQVKQLIEERIRTSDWPPDMKIPSENELVASLGVSRMTVHRALREMTAEGQLVRLQGVGTFVARPKPQSALLEIRSIAEEIESYGGQHSSEVHLLTEETANPDLATEMNLAAGGPVYHAILVHRDRGCAIQLADRYVNPVAAPQFLDQDFTRMTPNEYLLDVCPVTEVEHVIEAITPDTATCDLLEIDKNEPCLVLHRRTWMQAMVATKSRFVYPGSRHRIGGRFKPSSEAHRMVT
jgi:GntR family histidine utilization transcriptional repressor